MTLAQVVYHGQEHPLGLSIQGNQISVDVYKRIELKAEGAFDWDDWAIWFTHVIDFAELQASQQAETMASFNLYVVHGKVVIENAYAHTTNSKTDARGFWAMNGGHTPALVIVVPYKTSQLGDCKIGVNVPHLHALRTDVQIELLEPGQTLEAIRLPVIPRIEIEGPATLAPNAVAEFTARVLNNDGTPAEQCNDDIFLEATGGYLPLTRVPSRAGVAKFRLRAADLQPGESFKIKAGFKYYVGLGSKVLAVVE